MKKREKKGKKVLNVVVAGVCTDASVSHFFCGLARCDVNLLFVWVGCFLGGKKQVQTLAKCKPETSAVTNVRDLIPVVHDVLRTRSQANNLHGIETLSLQRSVRDIGTIVDDFCAAEIDSCLEVRTTAVCLAIRGFLWISKVDTPARESIAAPFHRLGRYNVMRTFTAGLVVKCACSTILFADFTSLWTETVLRVSQVKHLVEQTEARTQKEVRRVAQTWMQERKPADWNFRIDWRGPTFQ